jgi:hypothetical protein
LKLLQFLKKVLGRIKSNLFAESLIRYADHHFKFSQKLLESGSTQSTDLNPVSLLTTFQKQYSQMETDDTNNNNNNNHPRYNSNNNNTNTNEYREIGSRLIGNYSVRELLARLVSGGMLNPQDLFGGEGEENDDEEEEEEGEEGEEMEDGH